MHALVVATLLASVGCAAHSSHVRDPQGRPLPTTARLDSNFGGTELTCTDGSRYTIVEPPPPYLAGTHFATRQVVVTDAPRLCSQIQTQ